MPRHSTKRPLNRALSRAVKLAGGQNNLARQLKVRQSAVWSWLFETGSPTPDLCPDIERITGVPCEDLHPAFRRFAELRGLPQQKAAA